MTGTGTRIRVVIIDDMPDSIENLSRHLAEYNEIDILATGESVEKGFSLVIDHHPDIVFIDIEMPGKNGFELIKELRNINFKPTFIFITAFNKYAIEAIKLAVFDYLLKPIDPCELKTTLSRYKINDSQKAFEKKIDLLLHLLVQPKIQFNTVKGSIFIKLENIVYCEANGNYTYLYMLDDKKELISGNIGAIQKLLSSDNFVRISRTYIINKNLIKDINWRHNKCELMSNERLLKIDIPRKAKKLF